MGHDLCLLNVLTHAVDGCSIRMLIVYGCLVALCNGTSIAADEFREPSINRTATHNSSKEPSNKKLITYKHGASVGLQRTTRRYEQSTCHDDARMTNWNVAAQTHPFCVASMLYICNDAHCSCIVCVLLLLVDQREEHKHSPNQDVPLKTLAEIGVLYWTIDPAGCEQDPLKGDLGRVRAER
jgi:hypothetical protein